MRQLRCTEDAERENGPKFIAFVSVFVAKKTKEHSLFSDDFPWTVCDPISARVPMLLPPSRHFSGPNGSRGVVLAQSGASVV